MYFDTGLKQRIRRLATRERCRWSLAPQIPEDVNLVQEFALFDHLVHEVVVLSAVYTLSAAYCFIATAKSYLQVIWQTAQTRTSVKIIRRHFSLPKIFDEWYTAVRFGEIVPEVTDDFVSEVGLLAVLRDGLLMRPNLLFRSLIFLFFLGFVGGDARAGTHVQSLPAASLESGLPFAIADFDGDLRPDFVSVQAIQNSSRNNSYSIQLQLSMVGRRQFIQLVAPAGGLFIEARDVNGDDVADIAVSTAWRGQPVAIFLNDGHGGFSQRELTAFPAAFNEFKTHWDPASNQAISVFFILPQSRDALRRKARSLPGFRPHADSIPVSSAEVPASSSLFSHAGRAPPCEITHLQALGSSIAKTTR